MTKINIDGIREICEQYSGDNYYLSESIPEGIREDMYIHLNIPTEEQIIVFVKATIFGSGKKGMAIGYQGIYWSNPFFAKEKFFLSWDDFISVEIDIEGKNEIELGEGRLFDMSTSMYDRDDMVDLLEEIQEFLIDQNEERNSLTAVEDPIEWMIAVDGKYTGPYDLKTIGMFVDSGQVIPEVSYVWKQGMDAWVPFVEQPEMAPLIKPAMPPIPKSDLV